MFSSKDLQFLCNAAIEAALQAGDFVTNFDRHKLQQEFKDSGASKASQIVTQVDLRSEEIIQRRLVHDLESFDIAFVGEESTFNSRARNHERLTAPFYWCVDPLDGTLPYTQGRAGFAISIALVDNSGMPLIGVVHDPSNRVLYHAIKGQGCYRASVPFKQFKAEENRLLVYADASFKSHPKFDHGISALEGCAAFLELDGLKLIYGNGAVMNACRVMESTHACYLKLPKTEEGGGSIWDYAATACIANESEAWVSNAFGGALDLNRHNSTFMNHEGILFASNTHIARFLIDAL